MKTGALLRIPYTYKTGTKDIRICLSGKSTEKSLCQAAGVCPPCFYAAVFKLYIEQMRLTWYNKNSKDNGTRSSQEISKHRGRLCDFT